MKKYLSIYIALLFGFLFSGCMVNRESMEPAEGAPRLIISGKVCDVNNAALQGMYVAVYGVREPNEPDILTYNYAITDSVGQYTIIRYRGREIPSEVTVVVTDSTGMYESQTQFASFTYDTAWSSITRQEEPHNGVAHADFVLELATP